MISAKLALLSLALVAGEAIATAVMSRNDAFRTLLKARQGSVINPDDIPPECQTVCATMVTVFNNCQTDESQCLQICSNTVMGSVADCLSCTINDGGPPDASTAAQAQESLNELEDDCAQAGDPVNSFTVSGAAGVPTSLAGSDSGSLSLPLATGTSQEITFSASGASAPANSQSSSSKNIVTVAPTPGSSLTAAAQNTKGADTAASSSTAGSPSPTVTPNLRSGSPKTFAGASVAALAGAVFVLALNL